MTVVKKLALLAAVAASIAALPDSAAYAAGSGGSMSTPSIPDVQRERTPEDLAKSAYNAGYRHIKKAAKLEEDAAEATKPEKKQKALDKAQSAYEKALGEFAKATDNAPAMHEAWNYIGYAQRKLGRYDSALSAYGEALRLKPDYAQAIEYRGEAYLGLNRLEDARKAYLDLFAGSRDLAGQLLTAMKSYVEQRRAAPNGVDAQALEQFAQWVSERETIALQTAMLDTGAGSSASWR